MVSVSLAWRPKGTATDHKKSDGGGRENQKKQKFEQEKMSPQNIYAKWNTKKKIHASTKINQATKASGEVKMAAKHYTRLLNFLLNRAFLSVSRKNAAWTNI